MSSSIHEELPARHDANTGNQKRLRFEQAPHLRELSQNSLTSAPKFAEISPPVVIAVGGVLPCSCRWDAV
jgi:hypothetical protein